MILWVGLGNPGEKYASTRHNAGAILLHELFPGVKLKANRQWKSIAGELNSGDKRHALLFPQTFMNLSGDAVHPAVNYYKIGLDRVIVLHDEIDLPPGEVKYKFDGGHRGHNGLRDIIQKTGGAGFHRIRIGVGRPKHEGYSVADYVLSNYPLAERPPMETLRRLLADHGFDLP